jgi:hypothetical protein
MLAFERTSALVIEKIVKVRGVGTGGAKGSKVPFSCVKNIIKIAFFAQRALLKT